MTRSARQHGLARLSIRDTAAVLVRVILPTYAKGLMIRRPGVVSLVGRFALDDRAVAEIDRLRRLHGPGPVRLAVPGRDQALVLDGADAMRILGAAPEPFSPATLEKSAALGHFEPRASLISRGCERTVRRRFSDDVLESGQADHSMAGRFLKIVREETATLGNTFGQAEMRAAWGRAVRRIVLGETARDDEALGRELDALRRAGNWAYLRPRRKRLLRRYTARLSAHIARGEPKSLAARIAARPPPECRADVAVTDQVTHWLFAFDAAGIAAVRTLALLTAHPQALAAVRAEPAGAPPGETARAAVVETLRLYPTTPAILREATEDVEWAGGTIPARTHLIIFAPALHRDSRRAEAHRFTPEIWEPGGAAVERPYVPFSAGPAACPARHFVPMLVAELVRAIVNRGALRLLRGPALDPERLPGTLDHTRLRFAIAPDPPSGRAPADYRSQASRSSEGQGSPSAV